MTLRTSPFLGLATLNILLTFQLVGRAETLLDYTPPGGNPLNHSPGIPASFASSFTVGNQDVEITSVRFLLAGGGAPSSADTTVSIFSNSGSLPGLLLGSSHRAFGIGELDRNYAFYDYVFEQPLMLSAGVSYWAAIGIVPTGNLSYIAHTDQLDAFSGTAITPSLTHSTILVYPPPGDSWVMNAPNASLIYKLEGSVVAVPEPSVLAVGIIGIGLFLFQLQRRTLSTR